MCFTYRCLADLQILKRLYTTDWCQVFRARHRASGQEVALKLYHRWGEMEPGHQALVLNEVKLQQQCAGETVLPLVSNCVAVKNVPW